jgi:hypothetical protein
MFEGVTDRIIRVSTDSVSKSENQKGPFASGQILGDIFSNENSSSELIFLEDHAFQILEEKIFNDDLVDDLNGSSQNISLSRPFIRVTARLDFNDLSHTANVMRNFNDIGEAFWRVSNEPMGPQTNDRKILGDTEARKRAAEGGMQMHKKVLDSAATLMDFGFGDMLEASMSLANKRYVAPLKRRFLRDTVEMFVHKYSRTTQAEFSMLGLVTQVAISPENTPDIPDVKDADGMKAAMRTLGLHLGTIEKFFTGAQANEIVLDPIAIYSKIGT